jgi:hypothetical protein
MTEEQVKTELRRTFSAYRINQAAFYTEDNFVDEHVQYIVEQCGGTWDDEKAAEAMATLRRSQ